MNGPHLQTRCLLLLALAGVFALSGPAVWAGEYHVSPSGKDSNPGTAAAPWATLHKAAQSLAAGDTCIVHGGVYRETVRPARSGKAGEPVRFVAAKGEDVALCGTEAVTGWSVHEGKVLKAKVDWPIEQVFANSRIMTWARTPNAGATPYQLKTLKFVAEAGACMIEGLPSRDKDFWKGGVLWGMNSRAWVAQMGAIASSAANRVTFEGRAPFGRKGKTTGRAYLAGVLGALDTEGEWHQQGSMLYLIPPGRSNARERAVEVTKRRWAFDLSGRAHVEVRGFRIFAASINMDQAEHCVVDGVRASFVSVQRVMKGGFNRDRGISPAAEGLGIVLGGRNNTIRNSVVAYCTGDGVSIYGESNTVTNCVVHDCNTSASDCAPITCTGTGHAIVNCTLFNAGRSIVVHRKLRKGRIEHNHMFRAGLMTNDLGATYTFQTDGQGTVIAYNRIHDVHCHTGVGIYVDNMSPNHLVHHNLVTRCDDCGIRLNTPTRNVLIYNNTLTGNGKSMDRWGSKGNVDQSGCVVANNIMTDSVKLGKGATGHRNVLEGDPGFVNAKAGDYRLAADSPCIDAGVVVKGVTGKHAGKAPDIGCYEHGCTAWTAGSTIRREQWNGGRWGGERAGESR